MRPSFTVSLLLLSLLLSEQVQGIRLEKRYYMSVEQHQSIHVEKISTLTETMKIGVSERAVVCKEIEICSGNNRKLMSVTPSTTTTTTYKNKKNGKNKADPISNGEMAAGSDRSQQYGGGGGEEKSSRSVNSLSTSEEHPEYGHYPDVIDLAEMDYTPARRKPPIHN